MTRGPRRGGLAGAWALTLAGLALLGCGSDPAPTPARAPGSSPATARATNVLMIAVDTLRADRVGALGYGRPTTPHIDELMSTSVLFEQAQSSSSWTLPAFASVFTGLTSSGHRCFEFRSSLAPSYETMAEVLSANGYRTGGVVSHVFLGARHGLAQGFEHYDEELVFVARESHQKISSPAVADKAIAWLTERANEPTQPFFLLAHFFDPHHKYQRHPGVSESFGTDTQRDLYDGEIAFTDQHVGRVLSALASLQLAEHTIVIFVSDHGEEFFEHGQRGHGKALFQETSRVALSIRAPGFEPRRVSPVVRSLDVAPTLYELLGLPGPSLPMQGASLVGLMRGAREQAPRGALLELRLKAGSAMDAFVQGRWKLIVDQSDAGLMHAGEPGLGERRTVEPRLHLYDLIADPDELTDVAARHPDIVQSLRSALDGAKQRGVAASRHFEHLAPLDLTHEELESLRQLGYTR
ncbi:MAG: hypothetical protein DRQ55_13185 [Planctomycetota bacterium]|nr:MAG: hypothetical protein DRQ55_13185 [Planctomycetota bacterium]